MGRLLLGAATAGVLYAAAAQLALAWAREPAGLAPFWVASGIALVALLWSPPRGQPAVLAALALAGASAHALAGSPLARALGWTAAELLEAGLAAWILIAVLGRAPAFRSLREAVALLCAPVPAAAAGALVAAAASAAAGAGATPSTVARHWLASHYLGMLAVGFGVLGLRRLAFPSAAGTVRRLEALAAFAGLAGACAFVFGVRWGEPHVHYYPLLPVPFAVWTTVRFGTRGAAVAALVFTIATLGGTLAGRGPFVIPELAGPEPALGVQLYAAVVVGSILLLSSSLAERSDALRLAHASQRQLENAIESGGLGIWEWAPGTGEVAASETVFESLGYAQNEVGGDLPAWLSLVHPDDRPRTESALKTLSAGDADTVRVELRMRSGSGAYRWLLVRGVVTRRNGAGAPELVTGVEVDIDALKRAQEAQVRLARILEATPDFVGTADPQGRVRYLNAAARRMLGLSPDAAIETHHLSDYHPEWASRRIREEAIPHASSHGTWTGETGLLARDGRELPVSQVVVAHRSPTTGEVLYLSTIMRDLSERKRAEERLRHEHDFAKTVLETIPGLFYVVNRDGRYLRWNQSFSSLLGYSDEDMAQANALDLVAEEDRAKAAALMDDVFQGSGVSILLRMRTKDGETLPILGTGRAWHYGDESFLVGVALDMRDRLRIEEERRALEEQLRESQRLESVGRLAGGIAHDFNNLLTVILGYAEAALAQLEPGPLAHEAVVQIDSAGERARELTRQLLAFSRRQVLEVRVLDPNEVVESFVPLLRRTIPETIEITTELDPRVGAVRADRGQIEQVLMNLAVNAGDAMPDGGRITIRTEKATLEKDEGRAAPELQAGTYARLVFEDTGHGMDTETLEQIFEPFFTTKPYHEGTGLGLATIHGIVKQHGGDIEVTSSPGAGARFEVLLPVAPLEEAESSPASAAEPARREGGAGCVLLVEDDPGVRALVEQQLAGLGYELLVAESPEHALEMGSAQRGPVDLLLTDVVMPGMSGPELYERLARERPGLRVLYVSGYPADALPRRQSPLDPGVELLQKPFRRRELEARLRALLEDGAASGSGQSSR